MYVFFLNMVKPRPATRPQVFRQAEPTAGVLARGSH